MDAPDTPGEDFPNKRGRKSKLTPEVALGIALLVENFTHRDVAAKRFGIAAKTLKGYLISGRKHPEGIYGQFRELLLEAEAECERKAVAALTTAGYEDNPDHLKWLLERRFPERWGRHVGELSRIRKQIRDLEREVIRREQREQP